MKRALEEFNDRMAKVVFLDRVRLPGGDPCWRYDKMLSEVVLFHEGDDSDERAFLVAAFFQSRHVSTCLAVPRKVSDRRMNRCYLLCPLLASVVISHACLGENIRTVQGEEFKDAKVSRVEPDGITFIHSTGVVKIPFKELSADIQAKYHYDPQAAERFAAERKPPEPRRATPSPTVRDRVPTPEPSQQSVIAKEPVTSSQIDDAQFEDLRRRDWYETLKKQEGLKAQADFKLTLIADNEKEDTKNFDKCTPTFFKMLREQRQTHRKNYRALSSIAAKIITAKTYEDYKKLKEIEDQVLGDIQVQEIEDQNRVSELRLNVSERDAELLEVTQRYW